MTEDNHLYSSYVTINVTQRQLKHVTLLCLFCLAKQVLLS